MSENPFQDPPQPGRFIAEQWIGHLLLCEPERYLEATQTVNGISDAVEGTITVLTAPGGPEEIIGARVFQGRLIASLRGAIGGKPVLGRLAMGQPQPGKNAPYILADASPEDRQYAGQYWQQRQASRQQETFQGPAPLPTLHPLPNAQPQGYGAPSAQDQQWATQQRYVPPGVTTNVVPAPVLPPLESPTAASNIEASQRWTGAPAQVPTPAPQPPAPAPAQAPVPSPVTPAGPVAQAGAQPPGAIANMPAQASARIDALQAGYEQHQAAQPPASSVPEMDDEQFAGMPEDVQKLLDAARYARLRGGS